MIFLTNRRGAKKWGANLSCFLRFFGWDTENHGRLDWFVLHFWTFRSRRTGTFIVYEKSFFLFLSLFGAQMRCLPRCFKEEDDRAYLLVKIKLLEEQVAAEIDEKLRLREQVQSLKVENDHANDVSINAQKELSYYEHVVIPDLKADIVRLKQHDLKTNT